MALATVYAMDSLHALLRRPSGSGSGTPMAAAADAAAAAAAPVAACLDSYLPVYTFPASSAAGAGPASKLARVDSVPSVPDYFADARCDSPPPLDAELPPYGLGVADMDQDVPDCGPELDSFNDLPLSIPNHNRYADSAAAGPVMPYFCATDALTAKPTAVAGFMSKHHAPRRHASDVVVGGASVGAGLGVSAADVPGRSLLEAAVMALWEDRADKGLFRYDVSQCDTRVLPGPHGFVAQLNEGRATKKRATEFTADRVMQAFDPARFHFKKAIMGEALLAFAPTPTTPAASAGADAAVPRLLAPAAPLGVAAAAADGSSPNLVLINVSPIDHCHVLLVPRVLDCLPQALSPDTSLLALQFARELGAGGSGAFRVGYNSLGAFATINHLHFHAYHLPLALPCERAATSPLPGALATPAVPGSAGGAAAALASRKRRLGGGDEYGANGGGGVVVSRLVDYPVRSFVLEPAGGDIAAAGAVEAVAAVLARAAAAMQAANQPFNVLACDGGARVFVFPQCYAERQAAGEVEEELLDCGVNPASFEIGGHLVLKRECDYSGADEGWAARLLAGVSLDEERFMDVAHMCFGSGAHSSN